jgi:hypothetical protein
VRHLVDETEAGDKELPVEHFAFFEDTQPISVRRAFVKACGSIDELSAKRMRPKICVLRALEGYPTVQSILE